MLPDAIREMNKYSENEGSKSQNQHQHLEQELRNHMVLFRAQRNFYITGFSLFLVLSVYISSFTSEGCAILKTLFFLVL